MNIEGKKNREKKELEFFLRLFTQRRDSPRCPVGAEGRTQGRSLRPRTHTHQGTSHCFISSEMRGKDDGGEKMVAILLCVSVRGDIRFALACYVKKGEQVEMGEKVDNHTSKRGIGLFIIMVME